MRTNDSTHGQGQGGQILVVFAAGLIVLLLIGSLVVDLGMVFMQRRQQQNAADPGALAAARYIKPTPDNGKMWTAACFYAVQNGFNATRADNNAACEPGGNKDGSTLTVHWPPSRAAGEYAGNRRYVEVTISKPHQSLLAGVIGIATFNVATSAVAANDDGTGGSSSLVALSDQGCGGGAAAKINGGGSGGGIRIYPAPGVTDPGGYIQVNSDCGSTPYGANDVCGKDPKGAFEVNGSNTTVIAPGLSVQGACTYSGNVAPAISDVQEQGGYVGDPLSIVLPPVAGAPAGCPTGVAGTAASPESCKINSPVTLWPGTYYGGWEIRNNAQITLNPGIYIIAGGGISQTGGTLDSANGRVLIFGTDVPTYAAQCVAGSASGLRCQQDIDVSGTGSISLLGLDGTVPCPPYSTTGCRFGGMLLWQDGKASGAHQGRADIVIGGGVSTNLEGTVYSAGGDVSLTGSSVSTGCTPDISGSLNCSAVQIIAWTFQIGGAAILDMPYDPNKYYKLALKGLVK